MDESGPNISLVDKWTSEIEEEGSENGHLIEKNKEDYGHTGTRSRISWSVWIITAFNIFVFAGTLTLATHQTMLSRCTSKAAIHKTRSYSPILNEMTPELQEKVLSGSFVNYPPSIYRSDPSSEVNAAWAKLDNVGRLLISEKDVLQLGKDPKISSKAPEALLEALGRTDEGDLYFAQIDAFHQLHCLNEIRRHVYWDHYHKHKWGSYDDHTPHPLHWTHISHCLDNLRQNIMCKADVEMITSTWTTGQDWPFPDFNLRKKCGDFEQLQDYQEQKRIPEDLIYLLATPDDVELQPLSLEVYYALNETVPEGYQYDHDVNPDRSWDSSW